MAMPEPYRWPRETKVAIDAVEAQSELIRTSLVSLLQIMQKIDANKEYWEDLKKLEEQLTTEE